MHWPAFILDCITAVAGGCLGAALSALGGFVLFGLLGVLGLLYLLVAQSDALMAVVAGSVLLRPSVCFLGGVVAAAYARKRGLIACGKDIGRSFVAYRRVEIMAVAGCAGLAGYLANVALDALLAGALDTVALTVVLIPLALKYLWGMTTTNDCAGSSHAVPSPYRFFERFSRPAGRTAVSCVVGGGAALLTAALFLAPQTRPFAGLAVFFVSALLLMPVFVGIPAPATHHFSGPAGATVATWLALQGTEPTGWGLLLVALWGVAAAQIGLLAAQTLEPMFFTEGDIHVDPPAMGIVVSTAVMQGVLHLWGVYATAMGTQMAVALSIAAAAALLNLRGRCPEPQPGG
jgi:hypothetical protein